MLRKDCRGHLLGFVDKEKIGFDGFFVHLGEFQQMIFVHEVTPVSQRFHESYDVVGVVAKGSGMAPEHLYK